MRHRVDDGFGRDLHGDLIRSGRPGALRTGTDATVDLAEHEVHRLIDKLERGALVEVGSPLFTVVTDKAVVDVEDGLIVPVLRDADRLDLALSRVVEKAAQGIPEKNRFGGRGRPRFSRNVLPSYSRRRMPRRRNSGTTLSTKSSRPAGR